MAAKPEKPSPYPYFTDSDLPEKLRYWCQPDGDDKALPIMLYGFVVPDGYERVKRCTEELGLEMDSPNLKQTSNEVFEAVKATLLFGRYIWVQFHLPRITWSSALRLDGSKCQLFLAFYSNEDPQSSHEPYAGEDGLAAIKTAHEALELPADVEPYWYFSAASTNLRRFKLAE
ncbi:hypothetical protein BN946_scf184895.g16 [Trametes cinnabarina]|uniref:Uncharacterized protein n=1 Tax=Pycnoporus cinnabarinus TaxID=5643 RepID=A0A060SM24_PYCCI|nr:hypothetical protein BN946_scf184895.g16 [Trametes cinnabarina]